MELLSRMVFLSISVNSILISKYINCWVYMTFPLLINDVQIYQAEDGLLV